MRMYKAKNVDEYINRSAAEARPTLSEIREIIRATAPEAEETISWGIPFYKYNGPLAGFAAFKNHVSFGLGLSGLDDSVRMTLGKKGYVTGKKIVQIRFDQKAPESIIKRILKAQIKMNKTKKNPSSP